VELHLHSLITQIDTFACHLSLHHISLPATNTCRQYDTLLITRAVSRLPLSSEARVPSQAIPCEIYGRQSSSETCFLPVHRFSPVSIIPPMLHTHSSIYHQRCKMFLSQYFSFPCQNHSTNAPYSFIHLPPMLNNVYLPVLQFSPVSIIPPMLHTHSSIYHQRCKILISHY
jgi:hypothetical protein